MEARSVGLTCTARTGRAYTRKVSEMPVSKAASKATTAKALGIKVPAPVVAVAEAHGEPETWSWDDLPEAGEVEYVRVGGGTGKRVDVEATTPERIKTLLTDSYDAFHATYEKHVEVVDGVETPASVKKALRLATEAAQRIQPVPSEEVGKEFVKLARRYCKFRGWTFRGGVEAVQTKNSGEVTHAVVFRAKYLETRGEGE